MATRTVWPDDPALWPVREIWVFDTEFAVREGQLPKPLCMVAIEIKTGREVRLWAEEFGPKPPFPIDRESLVISYSIIAEMNFFAACGWSQPERVLDAYLEFRRQINGVLVPSNNKDKKFEQMKANFSTALAYHGLPPVAEKKSLQEKAGNDNWGKPWTGQDKAEMLEYCAQDVHSLVALLPKLQIGQDLMRAVHLRGRWAKACSSIEILGVPVDPIRWPEFARRWPDIQLAVTLEIRDRYTIRNGSGTVICSLYDEQGHFSHAQAEAYFEAKGIPVPRHMDGKPDFRMKTLEDWSKVYEELIEFVQHKKTLDGSKLRALPIGPDSRNRTWMAPLAARSGRSQPSNSKYIFGAAAWLRSFIVPPEGHAFLYVDMSQQEFLIAGVLSGDDKMLQAYASGDVYMQTAILTGHAPPEATEDDPRFTAIRDRFKQVVLAVQYLMGYISLAQRLNIDLYDAGKLLDDHRQTYWKFWEWLENTVRSAICRGFIENRTGWRMSITDRTNPRSIANFPMQSTGAALLQLSTIEMLRRDIEVVATIHDAVGVVCPLSRIEETEAAVKESFNAASMAVLGCGIRSKTVTVCHPNRYMDEKRGRKMWNRIMRHLGFEEDVPPPFLSYRREEEEEKKNRSAHLYHSRASSGANSRTDWCISAHL
jgi:DNA polymerase-1